MGNLILLWNNRFKISLIAIMALLAVIYNREKKIILLENTPPTKSQTQQIHRGPVKVIERVITRPDGVEIKEKETSVESEDIKTESKEVPNPNALGNRRFLVGASLNSLRPKEPTIKAGYVLDGIVLSGGRNVVGVPRWELDVMYRF
jgi:hypothetical protein